MRCRFIFAWRDLWIGLRIKRSGPGRPAKFHIFPFPMFGLEITGRSYCGRCRRWGGHVTGDCPDAVREL